MKVTAPVAGVRRIGAECVQRGGVDRLGRYRAAVPSFPDVVEALLGRLGDERMAGTFDPELEEAIVAARRRWTELGSPGGESVHPGLCKRENDIDRR